MKEKKNLNPKLLAAAAAAAFTIPAAGSVILANEENPSAEFSAPDLSDSADLVYFEKTEASSDIADSALDPVDLQEAGDLEQKTEAVLEGRSFIPSEDTSTVVEESEEPIGIIRDDFLGSALTETESDSTDPAADLVSETSLTPQAVPALMSRKTTAESTLSTGLFESFDLNSYIANLSSEVKNNPVNNGVPPFKNAFEALIENRPSGVLLKDLADQPDFEANVKRWELLTFKPGDVPEDLLSEKEMYKAILFSMLREITGSDMVSDSFTLDTGVYDKAAEVTGWGTSISKSIENSNLQSAMKSWNKSSFADIRISELTDADKNFLSQTYADSFLKRYKAADQTASVLGFANDVLDTAKDFSEVVEAFENYEMLMKQGTDFFAAVGEIGKNTSNNNLKWAASEIVKAGSSYLNLLCGLTNDIAQKSFSSNFKKITNDLWEDAAKASPLAPIYYSQKGVSAVMNVLVSTDALSEQYWKLKAVDEITLASGKANQSLLRKYESSGAKEDADAYVKSLQMTSAFLKNGADSAKKWADIVYNESLTGMISSFLFGKSGYNQFTSAAENLKSLADLEWKSVSGNWLCYLEEDYPDVYRDYWNRYKTKNQIKKADIVFFIDGTGSMGNYISGVAQNIESFAADLVSKKIDLNMAVVEYRDATEREATKFHRFGDSYWTDDVKEIRTALRKIRATGGGDYPETPNEAFTQLLDKLSDGEMEWREGAGRFAFLLTDATYKGEIRNPDGSYRALSMDDAMNLFREQQIRTTIVSADYAKKDYEPAADLSGGKFIDIAEKDYYKLMLEVADWLADSLIDTDGDGIPDEWEENGVTIDGTFINLPAMGADKNKKDVFVQIGWMELPEIKEKGFLFFDKTVQKGKSFKPSSDALKDVVKAYADHGINLHIDAGADSYLDYSKKTKWGSLSAASSIPYEELYRLGDGSFDSDGNYNGNKRNWYETILSNFPRSRWNIFHHALFVEKFDERGTSGLTDGQFFLVALPENVKNTPKAGTFMHELGHSMGLLHGGDENQNYKSNYLSVMNYFFQLSGLSGKNKLNYSDYILAGYDEKSFDESAGFDLYKTTKKSNVGTKYYYVNPKNGSASIESITKIAGKKTDLNKNKEYESSLRYDLNHDGTMKAVKNSINDWQHLKYRTGLIGLKGESLNPEWKDQIISTKDTEISYEEAAELGLLENPGAYEVSIPQQTFYTEIEGQNLRVVFTNQGSEPIVLNVRISSAAVLEDKKEFNLTLDSGLASSSDQELLIPLKTFHAEGSYLLLAEIENEDGEITELEFELPVLLMPEIEIKRNEKLDIPFEWFVRSSSDIIENEDGTLKALKNGTAVILVYADDGEAVPVRVTVVGMTEANPVQNLKSDQSSGQKNGIFLSRRSISGSTELEQRVQESKKSVIQPATAVQNRVTSFVAGIGLSLLGIASMLNRKIRQKDTD